MAGFATSCVCGAPCDAPAPLALPEQHMCVRAPTASQAIKHGIYVVLVPSQCPPTGAGKRATFRQTVSSNLLRDRLARPHGYQRATGLSPPVHFAVRNRSTSICGQIYDGTMPCGCPKIALGGVRGVSQTLPLSHGVRGCGYLSSLSCCVLDSWCVPRAGTVGDAPALSPTSTSPYSCHTRWLCWYMRLCEGA